MRVLFRGGRRDVELLIEVEIGGEGVDADMMSRLLGECIVGGVLGVAKSQLSVHFRTVQVDDVVLGESEAK